MRIFLGGGQRILDVGCGKGNYLRRLVGEFPSNSFYALDISDKVMQSIDFVKEKRTGSITSIPYCSSFFDIVYICEALEHSIWLKGALRELYRITKSGGIIIIIDKPVEKQGTLQLDEFEQWINDKSIAAFVEERDADLQIKKSVPYEGKDDGLFRCWIIRKKDC